MDQMQIEQLLKQGEDFFFAHAFDKAKDCFEKIISMDPKNFRACNNLGVIAFQEGYLDNAIFYFHKALSINKDHVESMENLGKGFEIKRDYREALKWYRKAISIGGKSVELLNSAGNCCVQLEDFSAAIELYTESIRLNSSQEIIKRLLREIKQVTGSNETDRIHQAPYTMSCRKACHEVVVAGMECTGSTFVYQVLMEIGLSPKKRHNYVPGASISIVTYRDPRDVICSYARRPLRELSETEGLEAGLIASHRKLFHEFRRHEDLRRYREDGSLLIRYEEYFNGREGDIINLLAEYLSIPIDRWFKEYLLKEFSIEKNKQRARQFATFSEYDRRLHIHGNHISNNGRSGVWRNLFTPRVRDIVKKDLGEFLVEFDYEENLDW